MLGLNPFGIEIGSLTRHQIEALWSFKAPRKENERAEESLQRDGKKLSELSTEEFAELATVSIPEDDESLADDDEWSAMGA